MKLLRQRQNLVACVLLGTSLSGMANAETYGQITVATDYLFRGVSQTMSGAALQGELGIEFDNGLYSYVWASNVRFSDDGASDDGARVEINAGAGYAAPLSDRVSLDVGMTLYRFPDTVPGADYDYMEWVGSLVLNETQKLTFGYSDNVFNSGTDGTFWSIGAGRNLTERIGVFLELGHFDLEKAFGTSYEYAEVAVTGSAHAVDWRLSYFTTSGQARELFEASTTDDRMVLSLSLYF